jgi:hypothetical protein
LGSAKEVALKLKELSELPVYFFGVTHRVIRRKDRDIKERYRKAICVYINYDSIYMALYNYI